VEEAAEPVVVEASESVAGSFHFLDDQVQSFGGSVGGAGEMVVEDLGPPSFQRPAESSDLFYVVFYAADDGLVHQGGRVGWFFDEVYVADGFFGEPGSGDLVPWVSDPQSEQHPIPTLVVETFRPFQQQSADLV
jgi:hypothetical protein